MIRTIIWDVKDGLCVSMCSNLREVIQIDWGSQQGGLIAYQSLTKRLHSCHPYCFKNISFILSHFHADHYNGLLYASMDNSCFNPFEIEKVYYPGIPIIHECKLKKELFYFMVSLNSRIFGEDTGSMEYDFLETIHRINGGKSFSYAPIYKGNVISINGEKFHILWPPEIITSEKSLGVIENAIKDFHSALDEDQQLREIYEKVKEEGLFEKYFDVKENSEAIKERRYEENFCEKIRKDMKYIEKHKEKIREELPQKTKKANVSLRKAANHFSVAFFNNDILFLGDLENYEIKEVTDDLLERGYREFFIIITPHHGTHWHECLKKIKCKFTVTSNGKKLSSQFKQGFKEISRVSLSTWCNGDIILP